MRSRIRPELSRSSKYWIHKNRHYELKYFCLQYPIWKKMYFELDNSGFTTVDFDYVSSGNAPANSTAKFALLKVRYAEKINLIETAARNTDEVLQPYILKAVTEGLSYTYLKTVLNIPCSKDTYYDRYRRFFWLLDSLKR